MFATELGMRPASMIKRTLSAGAEWDYTERLAWCAAQRVRVAERLEAEFDRALEWIGANPSLSPHCDERHRFCLLRRLPYQGELPLRTGGNHRSDPGNHQSAKLLRWSMTWSKHL
jgi:hypothetical protein